MNNDNNDLLIIIIKMNIKIKNDLNNIILKNKL